MSVNPLDLVFGAFGALTHLFDKPKAQPVPVTPPQAVDRTASVLADSFASRQGTSVNHRTGPRGAEATGGSKTKLGQ